MQAERLATHRVCVLGLALLVSSAGFGLADEPRFPREPVARMSILPDRVEWQPQIDYERVSLTISGPGGLYWTRSLEPGDPVLFEPVDAKGQGLPDGSYVYELRATPRRNGTKRLPLVEELVQSGSFAVQEGALLVLPPDRDSPTPHGSREAATYVQKDTIVSGDLIVDGNACIGEACASGDGGPPLRLKAQSTQLLFQNVSQISHSRDWALQANDFIGGSDRFFLLDVDAATVPFAVHGAAPDSSLVISSSGRVGVGTVTPATQLDVKVSAAGAATARLQNTSSTGYSGTEYLDNSGNVDLFFGVDNANSTTRLNSVNNNPIALFTNSTERMRVTSGGDIGIGTTSPSGALHVVRNTAPNVGTLLQLSNNKGIQILLDRTDAGALDWQVSNFGSSLQISVPGFATAQFNLEGTGDLTIGGTLTELSDRESKSDITAVDPDAVLAKLLTLPIATWTRKASDTGVRHMGPMAQDFAAAFGLGDDDRMVATLDLAGVSMASIQALYRQVQDREAEISSLRQENESLAKRLANLEAIVLRNGAATASPATEATNAYDPVTGAK